MVKILLQLFNPPQELELSYSSSGKEEEDRVQEIEVTGFSDQMELRDKREAGDTPVWASPPLKKAKYHGKMYRFFSDVEFCFWVCLVLGTLGLTFICLMPLTIDCFLLARHYDKLLICFLSF